ncbi:MAG: hypothetical protein U1F44_00390 [Coriobacteriia bacterium]|nr:hypothetical protein [Coriobacteriia bacterium]
MAGKSLEIQQEAVESIPAYKYASVTSRSREDDRLVLDTERPGKDESVRKARYYFEREDPDSNIVTMLQEYDNPDNGPRIALGVFVEMHNDSSDWKVLMIRVFNPDEMREYGIMD